MTDVSTGLEYDMLTTNMSHRYFNAIKTKLHVLGVASINREITQVKTGKKVGVGSSKKDEIKGSVASESRLITFRDDNFNIDSKSRFSEIVDCVALDSQEFIKAIENAIKAEHEKQTGTASIAEVRKVQEKQKEKLVEKNVAIKQAEFDQEEIEVIVTKLKEYIKDNKTNPAVLKPLLVKSKEFGIVNPTKVDNLEQAKELLALIEG
jgi:DNA integrity scanning protein DisA with diadenylate cyclase activity